MTTSHPSSAAVRAASLAALMAVAVPSANALEFTLSTVATDGEIAFDSTDPVPDPFGGSGTGSFSFIPVVGPDFEINTSDLSGLIGLQGSITGTFDIGMISTGMPGQEMAPVLGSGMLVIDDNDGNPLTNFTADVTFEDVFTFGGVGAVQTSGTGNLSNFQYNGSLADLITLAGFPGGTQRVTFQFGGNVSLTDLTTYVGSDGSTITSTNYSSTVSTVPIPAAAWLFGSAMFGMTFLGRRKQQA
jgi:hypothetical protein